MSYFRFLFLATGLFLLTFGTEGNCATIAARSSSQADVQAAVNSAGEGDTVTVPAGSATWSSTVTITNKAVTVLGAGMGKTVITCNNMNAFNINGVNGKFFRISGMTFRGSPGGNGYSSFIIRIFGTSRAWRIDNIHFESTSGGFGMIGVDGYTYGVVDNCRVTGPQPVHWFVRPYENTFCSPYDAGSNAWKRPLSLGTANAVYIESNDIQYDKFTQGSTSPVWDARSGARYVVRHNTIRNGFAGHHGAESYNARGTFSWEIYNNTFEYDDLVWVPLNLRGGAGVIHGNRFIFHAGNSGSPFIISEYRSGGTGSGNPWLNSCDTKPEYICSTFNGDQNPLSSGSCPQGMGEAIQIDGNTDGTGWPCRDQIGITYNGSDDGVQASSPVYEWDNVCEEGCGTGGANPNFVVHTGAGHLKLNRDYFNDKQKPGYTPLAYPHPLIKDGGGTVVTPPTAPGGLRIQ
ncbi:MAG: hypothetical protein PHS17_00590 [Desulfobacterales bacterium]|nr:hypothetical protein [Desulfobacterales bacterium]